ncbi:AraC family transcriptional regulator [Thalassospira sp.]|uniref:AraC family transcriptional regulator n=1 Tax=Thalassospira sp. TaxID=1912094 RepID=UPI0027360BF8|nr:AraC family transcriptional regulator [Thalassospira sp.]MDP2697145.1 AraC family transcriptional regulator [Thalassospira sp.]
MNNPDDFPRLVARYATEDGINETVIPRLGLFRASAPSEPVNVVYQPSICLMAGGRKQAVMGDQVFVYEAMQYLVVSMDVPAAGQVTVASPEDPYLCLRLDIDLKILTEMVLAQNEDEYEDVARVVRSAIPEPSLQVSDATPELIDAAMRLLRLLDAPGDIALLAPLIEREILYRLLQGPQGHRLRQMTCADSKLGQISRAVEWIRHNYREPFRVEKVAAEARMSPSALHQHFKAVTAMSPLQYQKQLRLQEARTLIMANSMDAASAGYHVGYESPSQFSREYRRLFGAPPRRDIEKLRMASGLGIAV